MSAETATEAELELERAPDPELACPSWCQDHADDVNDDGDPREHASRPLELGWLPELRDPMTGDVTRSGGGHLDSRLVLVPAARRPMVSIMARDLDAESAQLLLTSGEARTVAAQLLALADTADLEWAQTT